MKKIRLRDAILLCLSGIVTTAGQLKADSLWKRRDPQRASLFRDSRARQVGDLITVVISESSEVQNSEDKAMDKSSSNSVSSDFEATSGGGLAEQASNASLDLANTAKRAFAGKASYRDSREYTDNITVTVVDVLPNGNMVIAGKRCLTIAGEERTLMISGVVRAVDLGPDNKINSKLIADLRTVYEGKGASKRFVHQGWFSKAANKVWPF